MRIPYDSTSSKAECEYLLGVQKNGFTSLCFRKKVC